MNKTCLDCAHLCYSPGSPGYSEYTPGWDADMSCMKNHWVYDAYNDYQKDLKRKLYTAVDCPDFKEDE